VTEQGPGGQTGNAGPDAPSGSAREPIVIRDKRRIDGDGRSKGTPGVGADAPTMGQPGDGGAATDSAGDVSGRTGAPGPGAGTRPDPDRRNGAGSPAGPTDAGPAQSGPGQSGPGQSGPAQSGAARSGSAESGSAQSGTARTGADRVGADRAGAETSGPDQPGSDASGPDEARGGPLGAELEALRSELDERLRDLQRISAEYANYRKRVDRDRGLVVEQAAGAVIGALLPVLDDIDRARDHGDLVGPFAAVAEQLSTALGKFGLIAFGESGDRFDPTRHEAVAHRTSAEVSEPTCVEIMRRGYLLGDRLLRAALVAVADPQ
jgi:molecular chaperone GrpE